MSSDYSFIAVFHQAEIEYIEPHFSSQGIRVNEQPQKEVTPNEEGAKQLDEQKETINEAIEKLKAQEKQANEESDREKLKLTKIIDSQRQSIETLTRKLKDAGLANDKLKREKAELAKTLSIREKKIKKLTCELEEAIEAQEEKDEEIEVQKWLKIHFQPHWKQKGWYISRFDSQTSDSEKYILV